MQRIKLVTPNDYIARAKDFGIDLKFSLRSSGLQVKWDYIGDKSRIKELRQVFANEGVVAVHSFRYAGNDYVKKKEREKNG